MPRFFVPFNSVELSSPIALPSEATHHAMRVLRLRQEDPVEIFNGEGISVKGTIRFSTNYAEVIPLEVIHQATGLRLTLLQALVSNEKMDWIIEKACELGYSQIIVFPSERGEVKLNAEKAAKRVERWNKIALSACQQCGLNYLPKIEFCPSLKAAALRAEGVKFVLSPLGGKRSESLELQAVSFVVGPEGGLSPKEIDLLTEQDFLHLKLGDRILRTETAAIAAASYAQTLWGDFR